MKRVIVFDLDDTLYDEMTFVISGFQAVARFLEEELSLPSAECLELMMTVLRAQGRGRVFDEVLAQYGVKTSKLVRRCLVTYRSHKPDIRLYDDAVRCLARISHLPIYIVTDGNKHVQESKLKALGLYDDPRIKRCYITRRFGIRHEKPSPYCFLQICQTENVAPQQVVYIGDNPHKDFVGIKPLGFRTARLLRGSYAHIRKPEAYEADRQWHSLDEFEESVVFHY